MTSPTSPTSPASPGTLQELLDRDAAGVPGAVALVARGERVERAAAGFADTEGSAPMARDTIVRIASVSKPLTAAAVMVLVDDGRIKLGDPVERWLPELADRVVVRTPGSPVEDVVPAARPITVEDVLTSRAGYGFPEDFTLPAVVPLFSVLKQAPPQPALVPPLDTWLAQLSRIPLLRQPGEAWLYNTCSDLQGALVARVTGQPFGDLLAERLCAPLGMDDTGFHVPAAKLGRFTTYYRPTADGPLERVDGPDGQWSVPPAFPSGAGGMVSTAEDLLAFGRMLLAGGAGPDGRRLLTPESVRRMTTDHLTAEQRSGAGFFLQDQGWGYGGGVDLTADRPGAVPGRYGWVGGSGTSAYVTPSTGTVAVLLTQVELGGPAAPARLLESSWRYAARP
ncbi:serine hydrolase domain-containing protein [Streptomyces sp. V4-01]|uniref:Serine hydrolase domain-containing protein n=1 Tax=Actinacidiphila polyblastidii TaxID=3110430 RepID=A0ABU7PCJ6_9ACTN|nr:serine hydrolase domain-containing protein [Streptomyces sp. V4-01]